MRQSHKYLETAVTLIVGSGFYWDDRWHTKVELKAQNYKHVNDKTKEKMKSAWSLICQHITNKYPEWQDKEAQNVPISYLHREPGDVKFF